MEKKSIGLIYSSSLALITSSTMFVLGPIIFFLHIVNYGSAINIDRQCTTVVSRVTNNMELNCIGLTSVRYQRGDPMNVKVHANTTMTINIENSYIEVIPRQAFARFGANLEILHLGKCGIKQIEADAFEKLFRLKSLYLEENNLTWLSAAWFTNLFNLQHLDVSFNDIAGIDVGIYQMVPYLQSFYFDYNRLTTIDYSMFALLSYLKRVKLSRNPLLWGYRVGLMWQLDNQRVDYRDDWGEEWQWVSNFIRECQDNSKGLVVPNTAILDCVLLKLIRTEISGNNANDINRIIDERHQFGGRNETDKPACLREATILIQCSNPSTYAPTVQSVRAAFEGLTATLKTMSASRAKFNPNLAVY